jgi:hypothetical protein
MREIVFIIGLAVVVFVVWPFCCIWAVNTLFGTEIPFNELTWIAAVILLTTIASKRASCNCKHSKKF